jgi:hypothetical protein
MHNVTLQKLSVIALRIWREHYLLMIIFFIAILCDAASTIYIMVRLGPSVESHIVIRLISYVFGPVLGPLIGALGKAIGAFIIIHVLEEYASYLLVLITLISFWAAWYNLWGWCITHADLLCWLGLL